MRSGDHGVLDAARLVGSTPSMVIVDDPAPRMRAPMRLRNDGQVAISGSRAALSMTVVPLASTAAISAFSVAPTLGNSRTIRAPMQRRSAVGLDVAVRRSNAAPSCSRPRRCMSIGRGPKSSPPGSDTRARPSRASSGPSTTIDARIRSTSS